MRCGIDIVQISRIEDMACRHERSLGKFFTEAELAYCRCRQRQQYASLAGIFAAKEAFFKANGPMWKSAIRSWERLYLSCTAGIRKRLRR